jgi:hypothetical protein
MYLLKCLVKNEMLNHLETQGWKTEQQGVNSSVVKKVCNTKNEALLQLLEIETICSIIEEKENNAQPEVK